MWLTLVDVGPSFNFILCTKLRANIIKPYGTWNFLSSKMLVQGKTLINEVQCTGHDQWSILGMFSGYLGSLRIYQKKHKYCIIFYSHKPLYAESYTRGPNTCSLSL